MFTGARLKIDRANQHLADLKEIILDLPKLYTSSVEANSHTGGQIIEHDVPGLVDVLNTLALILGDCAHNLKSGLDLAWYERLSQAPSKQIDAFTKFPIANDSKHLEGILKRGKIDMLAPKLFSVVTTQIKPYKAGDRFLWGLHKLDVIDKHRLLLPVVQSGAVAGITLKNKTEGTVLAGDTWSLPMPPPYRISIRPTYQIENHGQLALAIVFGKDTPFERREVSRTLVLLSSRVSKIVELLEQTI